MCVSLMPPSCRQIVSIRFGLAFLQGAGKAASFQISQGSSAGWTESQKGRGDSSEASATNPKPLGESQLFPQHLLKEFSFPRLETPPGNAAQGQAPKGDNFMPIRCQFSSCTLCRLAICRAPKGANSIIVLLVFSAPCHKCADVFFNQGSLRAALPLLPPAQVAMCKWHG